MAGLDVAHDLVEDPVVGEAGLGAGRRSPSSMIFTISSSGIGAPSAIRPGWNSGRSSRRTFRPGALGQLAAARGHRIGREMAIDEPEPAGVDPLALAASAARRCGIGAKRAGEREVVDDDVGRVGSAQHMVARQRPSSLSTSPARAASRGSKARPAPSISPRRLVATRAPSRASAARSSGSFTAAARSVIRSSSWRRVPARGGGGWGRRGALDQPDVVDHAMAEIGIHPLDDLARRCWISSAAAPLDLEASILPPERAAGEQCLGLRQAGEIGTDDRRPLGPSRAIERRDPCALLGETRRQPLGQTADRAEAVFAHGPFQTLFLMVGHGPSHDHDPRHTTARLVRSSSSHPAVALRRPGNARPTLPCLAVGDHAAADHGRRSRSSTSARHRRWPTVEALAAAAIARSCRPGPGFGYYARARNLLACAAGGRRARRPLSRQRGGLRPCPASAPTRRPPWRAIAFDRPASRSTAMSSG